MQKHNNMETLFLAARNKNSDLLKTLIEGGTDVQCRDKDGSTVLMVSLKRSETTTWSLDENKSRKCVKILINAGVNVNAQNQKGRTALLYAAGKMSSGKCIQYLLAAGADVNLTDNKGRTALILAVSTGVQRYREIIDESDDDSHDGLSDDDDDLEIDDNYGIEQLVNKTADINQRDKKGKTALIMASAAHDYKAATLLLRSGANINLRDLTGRTPLMHNVMTASEYDNLFTDKCAEETSKVLLINGADINEHNHDGKTALMFAAENGSHRVVDYLISKGAGAELTDNTHRTALVYAVENLHAHLDSFAILSLLKATFNLQLGSHFRPLLDQILPKIRTGVFNFPLYRDSQFIRFCVCNGFTHFRLGNRISDFDSENSPLLNVLSGKLRRGKHRYFVANCFVFRKDLQMIRSAAFVNKLEDRSKEFIEEAFSNPWPLVKLSFIVVSSIIGPSPGREQRIRQTGLLWTLQESLMFQRPIACLPVHHWNDIPLCFNPAEYERLPAPYPLLYNWPFGRHLVTCHCSKCGGIGLSFQEY